MAKGKKGKVEAAEEKVASNVNCKVMSCNCDHDFQDGHYGKGKRLFNKTGGSGKGQVGWRCTVCGKMA